MPVGLICQIRPSCGETRLPHVGYEQFTLRSGRLPARCAAGGSAPAAGAGCCAAGRAGAAAIATAIAHAAPINDRMFWLTLLLLRSAYSSTTTYSLPATVIDRMNPSFAAGSMSFHAGEMR